jgi:hypothetical protein
MLWNEWTDRWIAAIEACKQLGGDNYKLEIQSPASPSEIELVENKIGLRLPESLREVIGKFSKSVEFRWFTPDGFDFPAPFRDIFCGTCHWGLDLLEPFEQNRKEWVRVCFPNPEDSYDRVWHNKLPFLEVGNADLLAIDMNAENDGPVVYLSHDDGEGHGYLLGANFIDFIDRWTRLGCPGAEDWQMLPFISSPDSFIDPDCDNAKEWRKLFNLNIE